MNVGYPTPVGDEYFVLVDQFMGIFQYVRDKNRNKVGLFQAVTNGNKVLIGFSFCNTKHDKFNICDAEDLAYNRALWFENATKESVYKHIPSSRIQEFEYFIGRCLRYYVDKEFASWVNRDLINLHKPKKDQE